MSEEHEKEITGAQDDSEEDTEAQKMRARLGETEEDTEGHRVRFHLETDDGAGA